MLQSDFIYTLGRDMLILGIHPFVDAGGLVPVERWRIETDIADVVGIAYVGVEDMFVVVSVLMFLRLPLVLARSLWLHSKAMRMKARFLARSSHIEQSLRFATRVVMRDYAVTFLLAVGFVSLITFGYIYYVFEREQAYRVRFDTPELHDPFSSQEYFLNAVRGAGAHGAPPRAAALPRPCRRRSALPPLQRARLPTGARPHRARTLAALPLRLARARRAAP